MLPRRPDPVTPRHASEAERRLANAWRLLMTRGLWWGYAALRTPADEFDRQGVGRFFGGTPADPA